MNSQFINVITEESPINEKYLYTESQGLWFIITLLSREELSDRIMFEARIEDILWRQGRHEVGDTFSFGRSKSATYGSWHLSLLSDGLHHFIVDYGGQSELQSEYPELNLDTEKGIIALIKKLKRDRWNAKMARRRK